MKKIKKIAILIISFSLIQTANLGQAALFISPMKMRAEVDLGTNESCEIKKVIKLYNNGTEPITVFLNSTNVDVNFEKDTITIAGREEKIIHPIINVTEGIKNGTILIKVLNTNEEKGTSSYITSSMVITVSSIGNREESEILKEDATEESNYIFIMAFLMIIFTLTIIYIIFRKKKNNIEKT